jgi:uncharacterized protein (TIGR03067 family)
MFALVIASSLVVGAPGPRDKPLSPVGEWVVERVVDSGQPVATPDRSRWEFKADGNWRIVGPDGRETAHGKYVAKPAKAPATLDLDFAGLSLTHPGIFKVEGDTLTVALAAPPGSRPTMFESDGRSAFTLFVLKRDK